MNHRNSKLEKPNSKSQIPVGVKQSPIGNRHLPLSPVTCPLSPEIGFVRVPKWVRFGKRTQAGSFVFKNMMASFLHFNVSKHLRFVLPADMPSLASSQGPFWELGAFRTAATLKNE
jgi:hypothetical protein